MESIYSANTFSVMRRKLLFFGTKKALAKIADGRAIILLNHLNGRKHYF
jgi:hypothetical protein